MLHAALLDCRFLNLCPFSDDGFVASDVGVGECDLPGKENAMQISGTGRSKKEQAFRPALSGKLTCGKPSVSGR